MSTEKMLRVGAHGCPEGKCAECREGAPGREEMSATFREGAPTTDEVRDAVRSWEVTPEQFDRWLEGERARVRTYDEEALAQALYRTLYDAGVSFSSNDVIPKLTATVRAVMTDHTDRSTK